MINLIKHTILFHILLVTSVYAAELTRPSKRPKVNNEAPLDPCIPPSLHNFTRWFDAHAHLKYKDNFTFVMRAALKKNSLTFEEFTTALQETTVLQFKQLFNSLPEKTDHLTKQLITSPQPYLQKLIIPATSSVYFFGDLHGDISSLVICLAKLYREKVINEQFQILEKPGCPQYIFFGGDFTDRGLFGAEVLQTIFHLKRTNPERVFLIRGNHEDINMNKGYGFTSECIAKFRLSTTDDSLNKFSSQLQYFYDSLPVAIFLGIEDTTKTETDTNHLVLCHGGLEFYDPTAIFQQAPITLNQKKDTKIASTLLTLNRTEFINTLPRASRALSPKSILTGERADAFMNTCCGFMWSDFNAGEQNTFASLQDFYQFLATSHMNHGGRFMFGSTLGNAILNQMTEKSPNHHIIGMLRAHQHNTTMPQLLCARYSKLSNDNQSLYKIPLQSGLMHHIFTKVSTSAYAPSPSFLKVTMHSEPKNWALTNFYINDFQAHVTKKEVGDDNYRQELYAGQHWLQKTQPLMAWENAFDSNSPKLIDQEKKLREQQNTVSAQDAL